MGLWDTVKDYGQQAYDAWKEHTPAGQVIDYLAGNDTRQQGAESAYPMPDRAGYDLPGYAQREQKINQLGNTAVGRNRGLDAFAQSRGGGQFQAGQGQLANLLMRQAQGQDSYSAAKLGQDLGRLQAQQQSMAAGARPSNSAMAQRAAMMNSGRLGADMAANAALAGIQERTAAAQAAGSVLGQGRGQDLQAYLGAQGLASGNLGLGLQAQNLGMQQAGMQQGGAFEYGRQATDRFRAMMGEPTQGERMTGMVKDAFQTGAMMSDIRLKQNVKPVSGPDWDAGLPTTQADWDAIDRDAVARRNARLGRMLAPERGLVDQPGLEPGLVDDGLVVSDRGEKQRAFEMGRQSAGMERFLGTAARPYAYEYRSGRGLPPGRRVGVMAQNVEQVAPDAVVNTPRGKMVDFNKLAPAAVAGLGYLNQKVNSLGQLLGDRRVAPPAAAPSRGYSITEDERAQLQKTKAGRAALGQLLKQHRGVVEEEGPLEATYRTRRPMPPGVQASVSKSEDLPKQARWLEDEHKRQWQRFNARPAWERELLRTRYGMRHGIAE